MGRVALGLAVGSALASCAIAAILVSRRVKSRRKWNKVVGVLKEFEEGCSTSIGRLRQVVDAMAVEMHAGLASEGGSKLKMLLTFIDNLPNGYVGIYWFWVLFVVLCIWVLLLLENISGFAFFFLI